MAWSIFQQGGGNGAALTWAQTLLQNMGAPVTQENEQFIYDWEKSEGGGGKYNPLNQGPVPGHPELTTTGSQYGGGAADYASYAAGIQGAVDYLNMPNYTAVKAAIMSNNPTAARSALIQSPWAASHYGNGSSFSNAPLPGQATSLVGDTGTIQNAAADPFAGVPGFIKNLFTGSTASDLWKGFFQGAGPYIVRGSLVVFGAVILIIGLLRFTGSDKGVKEVITAPVSGAKKVAGKVAGG